jgi:hypothetical protein
MLKYSTRVQPSRHPGRWIVHTRHTGLPGVVVVEPDPAVRLLVIVTAYLREFGP